MGRTINKEQTSSIILLINTILKSNVGYTQNSFGKVNIRPSYYRPGEVTHELF